MSFKTIFFHRKKRKFRMKKFIEKKSTFKMEIYKRSQERKIIIILYF